MHIAQLDNWFSWILLQNKPHSYGWLKSLVTLLLSAVILLNPMPSQAQPQASYNEHNMNLSSVNNVAKPQTVLVLGDSLSAAYGIDVDSGWVNLLADKLDSAMVVNASISGETTSGGKQRLPNLLAEHQPDVLILELGANDALRGQNLTVTQANLEKMATLCTDYNKNCRVVLLGIRLPANYGPVYDLMLQKMYQDVAKKYDLYFDPFFIEPVALDPDLMQEDGLHPNAEAQPLIMQRLLPLIADALSKAA